MADVPQVKKKKCGSGFIRQNAFFLACLPHTSMVKGPGSAFALCVVFASSPSAQGFPWVSSVSLKTLLEFYFDCPFNCP